MCFLYSIFVIATTENHAQLRRSRFFYTNVKILYRMIAMKSLLLLTAVLGGYCKFSYLLDEKKFIWEALSYDSKVRILWPFPVWQHQAYCLATAAVDDMCSLATSLGFCYLVFHSYCKWSCYARRIQGSHHPCLRVDCYSAPFVYSLNVHPPSSHPVIFSRKLTLDVPQKGNISRASAFILIGQDSGFLIWSVYFLTPAHACLHSYLYRPQFGSQVRFCW